MIKDLRELEQIIGYTFNDRQNLIEAISHPSYTAEKKTRIGNNQRLEFLGDAVVQIVVTDKIFHLFPKYAEGGLTKMRSALSKEQTLAGFARKIGMGNFLRLGHGERINKGHERDSLLCDAFEALIGAIYLDDGNELEQCRRFLDKLIDDTYSTDDIQRMVDDQNPKGSLQEWSQKTTNNVPVYELVDVHGPDHDKVYTIAVSINNERYGLGTARKRQVAEEEAARVALEKIKSEDLTKTN